ncbi:MAG: tetratricopeptide repeat protein, partial [Gemmataceae bacterium]
AAAVLESFRDRLGEQPEMQSHTAHLLRLQGKMKEAESFLDKAIVLYPNDPGLLIERGIVALRSNEFSAAEDYLSRAIRVDPGSLTARYHLIMALNQQGKKAEAEQQSQKASQLEADLKKIQELLNTQLQRAQPAASTFFEVAMIAQRSGQPREALRWLLSAIQADPNYVPAHRALAVFYRETGNPILSARHRALAQKLSAAPNP